MQLLPAFIIKTERRNVSEAAMAYAARRDRVSFMINIGITAHPDRRKI